MVIGITIYLLLGILIAIDFPSPKDRLLGVITFILIYPLFILYGLYIMITTEWIRLFRRPKNNRDEEE